MKLSPLATRTENGRRRTFEAICSLTAENKPQELKNTFMEGIYEVSSSDRVKRLQEDLTKELQELQNAIEENDFLKATPQSHKSFRCLNNCCLLILDFATRICSALQGAVREIQVLV